MRKPKLKEQPDVVGVQMDNVRAGRDIKLGPVTIISNYGGWSAERHQEYRAILLRKVHDFWVKGVLENSLYANVLISLGMETKSDAVSHRPWETVVSLPEKPDRQLSPNEGMVTVFRQMDQAMLILGEPGSGKTTMLLELVSQLIENREEGSLEPIPVVFNLSSWAAKQESLEEWLVDELAQNYSVSRKLAQVLVDSEEIALFLDGLDEVRGDVRVKCAQTINAYREDHASLPICVCCRREEYEALPVSLALSGALLLSQLSPEQVDVYLAELGNPLTGLRAIAGVDKNFQELAESPMMLSILVLTYEGVSPNDIDMEGTAKERRDNLFQRYVERMFNRPARTKNEEYEAGDVIKWLSWLAYQMDERRQTSFLIERLQPSWLRLRQWRYHLIFRLSSGLIFGLITGLSGGLVIGLIFGLVIGLGDGDIAPTEAIAIRFSLKRSAVGLLLGLIIGLIIGLFIGLNGWLITGLSGGLMGGLIEERQLEYSTTSNQGVFLSLKNGLIFGLLGGLIGGLIFGLIGGLIFGLSGGLSVGFLAFGGGAVIKHLSLRLILTFDGHMPLNYARFLDYCAERIFLRKVGGGYIFIHRLLLEYFADVYKREYLAQDGSGRGIGAK